MESAALVIGGSICGCLAAAVLARRFDRVTVVEREDFDDNTDQRRGVPQEKHVHLLLLRGQQVIESLFPGFTEELIGEGALTVDLGHGVKWYQAGRWKERYPTGIHAHYCSRKLIDVVLRRMIRRNSRVRVLSKSCVQGLEIEERSGGAAVTGVRVEAGGPLRASLVIVAAGANFHNTELLERARLGEVTRWVLDTGLGYASRIYRQRPEFARLWKVLLVSPKTPGERRMGVISPIEGGRWMVTCGGWFGEYPQKDDFLSFLQSLPVPDIYETVREATPLSEVAVHKFSGSTWHHYESAPNWPDGLLVMGDALCRINPIYSQGMTICALEAEALNDSLDAYLAGQLPPRRIQEKFAAVVRPAWNMAACEDMRFPKTEEKRTLGLKLRQWYGAQIAELSASDRLTLQTQLGVSNLTIPARKLYRPAIAGRVALEAVGARPLWKRLNP